MATGVRACVAGPYVLADLRARRLHAKDDSLLLSSNANLLFSNTHAHTQTILFVRHTFCRTQTVTISLRFCFDGFFALTSSELILRLFISEHVISYR